MGFHSLWISWIMKCVKSVRFSVKMNGEVLEPFFPCRGLRQGDPLSPYLFLFVADGLARIFNREVKGGSISPVKVARNSPGISNLLFADDSLVFFKATCDQARAVKNALTLFQKCTGQLLSSSKCSILFSEHCPISLQNEIKDILACETSTFLRVSTLGSQLQKEG